MSALNSLKPAALLSVTDKTGIVEFAQNLTLLGYRVLSTGGTAKLLQESGVDVTLVSEYTGSDEILGGRVKTLHPKIHAGILWQRQDETHQGEMQARDYSSIDIVAVNLYDFENEAYKQKLSPAQAIEFIDIGGPTMLRAAAKNYQFCLPVIDPNDYNDVIERLKNERIDEAYRLGLAAKVFTRTANYDAMISSYLATDEAASALTPFVQRPRALRYGENPHQTARLHIPEQHVGSLAAAQPLQGKELSYNNYLDMNAALLLARDLNDKLGVVIVKHTNPCGAAIGVGQESQVDVFRKALACDPVSAFGSIIAITRPVDAALATEITSKLFVECLLAPGFEPEALTIFQQKKNLRLLQVSMESNPVAADVRSIDGGFLEQDLDQERSPQQTWQTVTQQEPSAQQRDDLYFANIVAKHVKSNTLVFAKAGATLAVGAGQMSRIDAGKIAVRKAEEVFQDLNEPLEGCVMASDAFFPFKDTVEFAASAGVKAIIQPGGSKRDDESIAACNELGLSMVFTGQRHFRH